MDLQSLIANVGFPMGVATYLLVRFEKKLDGLTKAITALATQNATQNAIQNVTQNNENE